MRSVNSNKTGWNSLYSKYINPSKTDQDVTHVSQQIRIYDLLNRACSLILVFQVPKYDKYIFEIIPLNRSNVCWFSAS